MNGMLLTAAAVGFVLGVRHALDPDHVVAVSTIVSQNPNLRRCSLIGGFWGLGHALTLLIVGGAVVALRLTVPAGAARWLECGVAAMLVLLGVKAIYGGWRGLRMHAHAHTHDGREHLHLHAHRAGAPHIHGHHHSFRFGWRPFAVGVIHGLAGSAGLAILVLSATPSAAAGLLYIGMLALGSLGGMLILSAVMSLPLAFLAKRYKTLAEGVQLAAGLGSLGFGLWLFSHYAMAGGAF